MELFPSEMEEVIRKDLNEIRTTLEAVKSEPFNILEGRRSVLSGAGIRWLGGLVCCY